MKRIEWMTLRGLAVLTTALLVGLLSATTRAADDELAADRALRTVLRPSIPLVRRLEAARGVLDDPGRADGESLIRAGAALLEDAPEVGGWLMLRGAERVWPNAELREEIGQQIGALLDRPAARPARRAAWGAAGFLLRYRPDPVGEAILASWPPSPLVRAVIERDLPGLAMGGGEGTSVDAESTRHALDAQLPVLRALDQAESEDPAEMRAGLDALLALGPAALPVLLSQAQRSAVGVGAGALPRATRAVLALGLLGQREATPHLIQCLRAPSGWVRVAAATALGDLGDPAAAVALCWQMTYRGDTLRPRDQWDYPGERETTVAPEDWASAEYYVVDGAAADALLRLGVPGAAGWLIRSHLDPSKANYRIRVLQDAVDALRRAAPAAPIDAYNVDAGWVVRRAAYEGLLAWWGEHAFAEKGLLATPFDASDGGFVRAARRMVERLRGRSIMELQIAHETCAILGPAVTPILLEVLEVAENRVLRTEVARALGAVRDTRAVDPLLRLARERAAFLRAVAAGSLGAYVEHDARAAPALVALLSDPEGAPRVAALSALVSAPVSEEMRAVVRAHPPEAYRRRFGADDRDYRIAWTVALLVQEGESHWPAVREGLAHAQRYVRQSWWSRLRRALALPNHVYDVVTDPSDRTWQAIDESRVLQALDERRSG